MKQDITILFISANLSVRNMSVIGINFSNDMNKSFLWDFKVGSDKIVLLRSTMGIQGDILLNTVRVLVDRILQVLYA